MILCFCVTVLQPDLFDPYEAVDKFSKFVRMLAERGEVSLMPDLPVFFFFLELFAVLGLLVASKLKG